MPHTHCLNCGQELQDNFCAHCGQSAHTHRFSLKHIFSHDLVHGLLHLDSGFFYTAKMLLTDPGNSIRDYIAGKRVKHYNYIAFIILMVALNHLISAPMTGDIEKLVPEDALGNDASFALVVEVFEKFQKYFTLLLIPVLALFTKVIFKRADENYAEHLVLNAFMSGGKLIVDLLVSIFSIIIFATVTDQAVKLVLTVIIASLSFLYILYFYWQYFRPFYKNGFVLYYKAVQAATAPLFFLLLIAAVAVKFMHLF